MFVEMCVYWQELELDFGGCMFFCVICQDFWVWNLAWNLHNLIFQCVCERMIHSITLKESQLNVCDTPRALRLGCSVKLDDGVYEESDWFQVSSCHGPSCVSMGWCRCILKLQECHNMCDKWNSSHAHYFIFQNFQTTIGPYALVILHFHHNSLDIWYMFYEEDNQIS